jgi:hypothetical protein
MQKTKLESETVPLRVPWNGASSQTPHLHQ